MHVYPDGAQPRWRKAPRGVKPPVLPPHVHHPQPAFESSPVLRPVQPSRGTYKAVVETLVATFPIINARDNHWQYPNYLPLAQKTPKFHFNHPQYFCKDDNFFFPLSSHQNESQKRLNGVNKKLTPHKEARTKLIPLYNFCGVSLACLSLFFSRLFRIAYFKIVEVFYFMF